MKLRNKKTGLVGELHYEPDKEYHFTLATEDPADMEIYRTLSELNEEWEDYKPAEPLIKDEKKLSAVKSFFTLLGVTKGIYYQSINNCFYYTDDEGITYGIDFDDNRGIENIYTHIEYTIAELCGEEGE